MTAKIFNNGDLIDIMARGMTPEKVLSQLATFETSLPSQRLLRPCTVGDGIVCLGQEEVERVCRIYEKAALSGRAMKFVPASGAASRMFNPLLSCDGYLLKQGKAPEVNNSCLRFLKEIKKFPFYEQLESVMMKNGMDIEKAISERDYQAILDGTLGMQGLDLARLPKGLIPFHRYPGSIRTPIEEHMVEAAGYVKNGQGIASVHFTVSPEHKEIIRRHIKDVSVKYERPGLKYVLGFSEQKSSTDTIAVDMNNNPIRDRDGRLLFRPAGHGALLENLENLKADIVFIKNIDNVAPDRLKHATYTYKKALGGLLVELQKSIFGYQERLAEGYGDEAIMDEVFDFIRLRLCVTPPPGMEKASVSKRMDYLSSRLNRPVRVCGMVRNVAEPGGGPFWVRHGDGTSSIQIVEVTQVDMNSNEQKTIFESSTHFNPVDLVCGMRDHSDNPFNLNDYVDHNTSQITIKSKDGKEIKALELPGLWNGSMAYWNSVFVEVPLITFNPVKTIFDLLREEHQM